MLKLEFFYWLVGAFLLASAAYNFSERRYSAGAFWLVLVAPFAFGSQILAAAEAGVTAGARPLAGKRALVAGASRALGEAIDA